MITRHIYPLDSLYRKIRNLRSKKVHDVKRSARNLKRRREPITLKKNTNSDTQTRPWIAITVHINKHTNKSTKIMLLYRFRDTDYSITTTLISTTATTV